MSSFKNKYIKIEVGRGAFPESSVINTPYFSESTSRIYPQAMYVEFEKTSQQCPHCQHRRMLYHL